MIPDHGATIRTEAEWGDSAVVALQHTHTLTGAQVPQPNATVQRGGKELQPVDIWMELDQAANSSSQKISSLHLKWKSVTCEINVLIPQGFPVLQYFAITKTHICKFDVTRLQK